MDNKMLISMMGTSAPAREGGSSTAKEADADAFSQALEKATGKNAGAAQGETTIIADKNTRKADEKSRKEDRADANLAKLQDPKALVGSRAYLYHLAYKNPDTLTMAEKQALKLGQASKDAVGLKDLQRMMAERGLSFREMSFSQMADLTRRSGLGEVTKYLDSIQREKTGEEPKIALVAEAGAASNTSVKSPLEQMLDGSLAVKAAAEAAGTRNSAAVRRRQEVIDQIVQQMEIRNLADRDELHLKLNPEYLGELKIQLTHDSNGEISARFLTTSEDTRAVLQESKVDLRQHVERRGLRMRDIDVDLVEELV